MRVFTFGHVRQGDAVACRFLRNLAEHAAVLGDATDTGRVMVDLDDTVVETGRDTRSATGSTT